MLHLAGRLEGSCSVYRIQLGWGEDRAMPANWDCHFTRVQTGGSLPLGSQVAGLKAVGRPGLQGHDSCRIRRGNAAQQG